MQINIYTIGAFLFFAVCVYMPASCEPDNSQSVVRESQERHRAAMKDWGKTDYVPVTNPFE